MFLKSIVSDCSEWRDASPLTYRPSVKHTHYSSSSSRKRITDIWPPEILIIQLIWGKTNLCLTFIKCLNCHCISFSTYKSVNWHLLFFDLTYFDATAIICLCKAYIIPLSGIGWHCHLWCPRRTEPSCPAELHHRNSAPGTVGPARHRRVAQESYPTERNRQEIYGAVIKYSDII